MRNVCRRRHSTTSKRVPSSITLPAWLAVCLSTRLAGWYADYCDAMKCWALCVSSVLQQSVGCVCRKFSIRDHFTIIDKQTGGGGDGAVVVVEEKVSISILHWDLFCCDCKMVKKRKREKENHRFSSSNDIPLFIMWISFGSYINPMILKEQVEKRRRLKRPHQLVERARANT